MWNILQCGRMCGRIFPLNLFVIVSFHIQIIKGSEPSNVVAIQIHIEPVELVCVGGRVNFFFFVGRQCGEVVLQDGNKNP